MKKIVPLVVIFLLFAGYIHAQDRDLLKEYEEFRQKATKEYNDFRDKANAEYAEFMRQAWKEFGAESPVPVPPSPDPPQPPVFTPEDKPTVDSVPVKVVIPAMKPIAPPKPVVDIPVSPIPVVVAPKVKPEPQVKPLPPDALLFTFSFYNTDCRIRLEDKQKISLKNVSEETIADAWEILSDASYNPVIADCLHLRDELNLCDWGYYQLLETIANKYYGSEKPNEVALFQSFILTQSGYKVRMARTQDNFLATLVPFDCPLYNCVGFNINGQIYYLMDKKMSNSQIYLMNETSSKPQFYICDFAFPKEQIFSIQVNSMPEFNYAPVPPRKLKSAQRSGIELEIKTNQNLIDFFNAYPLISGGWNLYAKASLSEQVKEQLYPVLQNAISEKSQSEAAGILINFVQTAFAYKTDDQQFGYERPLFGDESFFYPYNDCEDRSILFSTLVRELLGLDAVLLYYPGHLATAVRFEEEIEGDFLMVNDQKYIICDPTYIGASIGTTMPGYDNESANVIKL